MGACHHKQLRPEAPMARHRHRLIRRPFGHTDDCTSRANRESGRDRCECPGIGDSGHSGRRVLLRCVLPAFDARHSAFARISIPSTSKAQFLKLPGRCRIVVMKGNAHWLRRHYKKRVPTRKIRPLSFRKPVTHCTCRELLKTMAAKTGGAHDVRETVERALSELLRNSHRARHHTAVTITTHFSEPKRSRRHGGPVVRDA